MYGSVSVYKQQCSYLHDGFKICNGTYFMKTAWDINKAADTSMHLSSHSVLYAILTSNDQLYYCSSIAYTNRNAKH